MKFKRILALLLTVLMLFSLTACGMDRQTVSDALDTASALLDTLPDEEPVPDAAPEESPHLHRQGRRGPVPAPLQPSAQ